VDGSDLAANEEPQRANGERRRQDTGNNTPTPPCPLFCVTEEREEKKHPLRNDRRSVPLSDKESFGVYLFLYYKSILVTMNII
jgi:hypothetical protein